MALNSLRRYRDDFSYSALNLAQITRRITSLLLDMFTEGKPTFHEIDPCCATL